MGTITALPHQHTQIFWGEMAPCEHIVQIYGDDSVFFDALEGFVASALRNGESAIVIATAGHLHTIEKRMRDHGIDVEAAREQNRFVPRLAEEVLERFMVQGWPDPFLFQATILELTALARGDANRKTRAFGEMVALLWARGAHAATLELEKLWNGLCASEQLPLFCAYPKAIFPKNAVESIVEICRAHSLVVSPEAPLR